MVAWLRHDGHCHHRGEKLPSGRPPDISCPLLKIPHPGSREFIITAQPPQPARSQRGLLHHSRPPSATMCNQFRRDPQRVARDAKITVIATGFQPESPFPSAGSVTLSSVQQRPEPEPVRPVGTSSNRTPSALPLIGAAQAVIDMDDLDTPACLRQGRLLN